MTHSPLESGAVRSGPTAFLYGEPTLKASSDAGRDNMDCEERKCNPSERLNSELNEFLYGLIPKRDGTANCNVPIHTITPDRQFIISKLKKHGDVILALGNAHVFKFAPAIGRVTAELALHRKATDNI
ncbi:hypothetical protein IL306_001013 [Fusarium sp. DS 682]|nr:hypothetical protein IL306_001013 [Fusarium sp. DS 682]